MSSMSLTVAKAWSLNSSARASSFLEGIKEHFLSAATPACCKSKHFSLIAVLFSKARTLGLMHRFFLDPSDRCFTRSSSLERSSLLSGSRSLGILDGKVTRRNSPANWLSWECVLEQKKILISSSPSSSSSFFCVENFPWNRSSKAKVLAERPSEFPESFCFFWLSVSLS